MVEVAGRRLQLSNLDKVLYPRVGFTKAEVIRYYAAIAPVMLPHLAGRCVTFRRFPDGVDGPSFFEKRCPSHRPDWVDTAVGPGDRNGEVRYCLLEEPAALVWSANLAALELHTPMSLAVDLDTPTTLVFDLDPGPDVGIAGCARVALEVREVLDSVGLTGVAKTSGSKGMQLYVPLNTPHDFEHTRGFALAVGQLLERRDPTRVTTEMTKSKRVGRVFIDWSQNVRAKTTVCVYSLRARPEPTVSTPLLWEEVERAAAGDAEASTSPLSFTADDVLERVADHGDLFAPVLTVRQQLPNRT